MRSCLLLSGARSSGGTHMRSSERGRSDTLIEHSIRDKVVVVTGTSSGNGKAMALLLAEKGASSC